MRRIFLSVTLILLPICFGTFVALGQLPDEENPIIIRKQNGVFRLKCYVNTVAMDFIFDTGASTITISLVEATYLAKNGFIDKDDLTGIQRYKLANGEIVEGATLNLKEVRIDNYKLKNIEASIIPNSNAPLLFGLTGIEKLGKVVIEENVLIIYPKTDIEIVLVDENGNAINNNFPKPPPLLNMTWNEHKRAIQLIEMWLKANYENFRLITNIDIQSVNLIELEFDKTKVGITLDSTISANMAEMAATEAALIVFESTNESKEMQARNNVLKKEIKEYSKIIEDYKQIYNSEQKKYNLKKEKGIFLIGKISRPGLNPKGLDEMNIKCYFNPDYSEIIKIDFDGTTN